MQFCNDARAQILCNTGVVILFGQEFRLKHYAGDVTYNVKTFMDKNNDLLYRDLKDAMARSTNKIVQVSSTPTVPCSFILRFDNIGVFSCSFCSSSASSKQVVYLPF